ncbi:phosphate/phosphite/phosphonate ABC transporter substrate-binding protein [Candidatus Venteria ishoeyi]|uniref:Phosphate-import protein PhnD n=1 Tax=Candidatus Venteria ishoeyi TaxID=1899563 RepID=A0A1H6F5H0_9GAMM|nr:phosphate/phosphite/phosphonate ABC transporter substrate-binding protein [Candidatus Venteria ishoeyi]MDM8547583.1 phosphate/phosphite/phosphonate ABC transporter substrate-binding protein [Candidatus Venteria ishoeyi]SEH04529.1 Phosphate-import protein PhnD precursor [Candidatus Venteria ishoeyi]
MSYFQHRLLRCLLLGLLWFAPLGSWAEDTQDELVFGIHPYLSAQELFDKFGPLAEYLTQKTAKTVRIHVAKSYQDHLEDFIAGKVDFAYMGPSLYVQLLEKHETQQPLARLEIKGKPYFRGAIIVAGNSPIKNLVDLKGKHFAFGSPHSTMSHLVPRYMLIDAGVTAETLAAFKFIGNHESVALSVLMGEFDAGGVKEEVAHKYEAKGLKVLQWTPEISEHVFAARSNLPQGDVEALRDAMLQLKDTKVLKAIKKTLSGLVSVSNEDYDNLRIILTTLKQRNIP